MKTENHDASERLPSMRPVPRLPRRPLRTDPLRIARFKGITLRRCRDRVHVMYEMYVCLRRMLPVARCLSSVARSTHGNPVAGSPHLYLPFPHAFPVRWHDISTSYRDRNVVVDSFSSCRHGSLSLAVATPVSSPSCPCLNSHA